MPENLPQDSVTTEKDIAKELYKKNLDLLKQSRRVEQLLYSVSEAIFAVDENNVITLFNNAMAKMSGWEIGDALGKKISEIIAITDDKSQPVDMEEYISVANADKKPLLGATLIGKTNKFYVNVKASIIDESNTKECLVTVTDITNEKVMEKLKDDFLSVASHELRTPMTIIKSYLWMMTTGKGGTLSEKQNYYIQKALGGADRLIALVNDMLNVSRIEQGKANLSIEKVYLDEFLENVYSEFKIKTNEKGISFSLDGTGQGLSVFGDKTKLSEVFANLIGNAVKFTDNGGDIHIRIGKDSDMFVKVSVADSGKGIDKQDTGRLFQKFGRLDNSFRTVAEAGGTGLGLYITKNLVEVMGGKIGVFSEGMGKGSTFWVLLPTNPPSTASAAGKQEILKETTGIPENSIYSIAKE